MSAPPRPPAPRGGPVPSTVPPGMAARESILRRAQQVASAHVGGDSADDKPHSSDWRTFFSEKRAVSARGCQFNVYTAGPNKPPADGQQAPVLFCVHGGGYTGLSFALIAEELRDEHMVVALDMRHHGESCMEDDSGDDIDMSRATLCADLVAVWRAMFAEERPPTVLLGHSVGGALAVWAALEEEEEGISTLEGLVVVDVVEGTAVASLPTMQSILSKRPQSFTSVQRAIEWSVENNMCKSRRAAAISMPAQLREERGALHWRTPLAKSEPFWLGWYEGLSEAFLRVKVPKVLVLAGSDRLDKPLTIAQMQGKFQMVLVPNSGHAVQEDDPERMAETVSNFVKRFRIGQPPLVIPKAAPGLPVVLPQAAGPLHGGGPSS